MKVRFLLPGALIASVFALSACSIKYGSTLNQNRWMKREVTSEKLANGKQLMVGYHEPTKDNECQLVGKESKNWAEIQFKEQFKPHISLANSGYWGIKQIAIQYANKNPSVNYVYLLIPNQQSIQGFKLNPSADAVLSYYSCKKPPEKHTNL
jgi:hypothetical protein